MIFKGGLLGVGVLKVEIKLWYQTKFFMIWCQYHKRTSNQFLRSWQWVGIEMAICLWKKKQSKIWEIFGQLQTFPSQIVLQIRRDLTVLDTALGYVRCLLQVARNECSCNLSQIPLSQLSVQTTTQNVMWSMSYMFCWHGYWPQSHSQKKNIIEYFCVMYIVACQRGGVSNEPPGQRQDTGPGILFGQEGITLCHWHTAYLLSVHEPLDHCATARSRR